MSQSDKLYKCIWWEKDMTTALESEYGSNECSQHKAIKYYTTVLYFFPNYNYGLFKVIAPDIICMLFYVLGSFLQQITNVDGKFEVDVSL